MKPNIGKAERVARVVVGLGVLSLAVAGPHTPWAYLGILPLLTGLVGWCPPYALLGISTVGTRLSSPSPSEGAGPSQRSREQRG